MTELNEKLAKWVGFTKITAEGGWNWPDGKRMIHPPDFCNSLDACFKWLVPKLTFVQVQVVDGGALCLASAEKGDRIEAFSATDQPAYALCKAIEKVLDA